MSSVDMGSRYTSPDSSILTGLFDGDLSSPCYKDRRWIFVGFFVRRGGSDHDISHRILSHTNRLRHDIILANAGLRLLIREDPPSLLFRSLPPRYT